MSVRLDSVQDAIREIAVGKAVIVVDDEDRENEGDLIFAASKATPDLVAFMIRYTSGVICVPMDGADLDRLGIPLMTHRNRESMRTAYTISVDARDRVTTGISAADRARTIKVLADSASEPYDLVQPGHIFPLRAREGGVLVRPGHTEATIDLARLAGLIAYRRRNEKQIERIATTTLPTAYGDFVAHGYHNTVDGSEQIALVRGPLDGDAPVLVRMHSECLTGDVFGSQRCDCGPQLEESLRQVAATGGVLIYLRGHEGRGIGLLHKLRAY